MPGRVLLAESDSRSLRILELALRKAGIPVEAVGEVSDARRLLAGSSLLICDVALDGILLCEEAKRAGLPVVLLAVDKTLHARAVVAGADEFMHKPVLLKELVQRVHFLLERREEPGPAGLTGAVRDLGLLDVFHSLAGWKKSALVRVEQHGQDAKVWVKDGEVVDAELTPLHGDAAFYRLMTWDAGQYAVQFGEVDREARIQAGTHGALLEAMRRVDELARVAQELPMTSHLEVDYGVLLGKLATLPDEMNGVVRCFDGKRTLREAIDHSPLDDLATLSVVQRLRGDGILKVLPALAQQLPRPPVPPPEPPPPPIDLFRFPPVRGVRRERVRREAEQARQRVAAGQPVRLGQLVEMPAWGNAKAIEGRVLSSPGGEAARTYAPDLPMVSLAGTLKPAIEFVKPPADAQASPPPPKIAAPDPDSPGVARPRAEKPMADLQRLRGSPASEPERRPRWPWFVVGAALAAAIAAVAIKPAPVTDRSAAPWLAEPKLAPQTATPAPSAAAPAVADPPAASASDEEGALQRGAALLERGQYREAIAELKKAAADHPRSAAAQLALGNAYLESDSPKNALKPLQAAAALDGNNARAQLLLGTAYQSVGKNADAARAYKRYLELDPGGEYAHDVRLILENLRHSG
jgi:DNA-binding response OmpR family regulator/Flp pilus assembly protein TadD